MAPHRALTIPDVLYQVFKHFATHPWLTAADAEFVASELPPSLRKRKESCDPKAHAKDKRRTLAYAARTCKAFAEPASHVLWEAVDGLGPILSVLKNAQTSGSGDKAPDWARFEHVARRVRALFAGKGVSCDVDTLALIRSRYDSGPILPNLRALFYGFPPLDAALLRALCASPALISIRIIESSTAMSETLVIISKTCPEITHLDVVCYTGLNEDGRRALAKFNNLHTAQFTRIDNALFRYLGTLPNLRELHGVFTISNPDMATIKTAFPVLQELVTKDESDESDFLAALPFISSASLAVLSLHTELERTEDLLAYLDTLCAALALAHLRALTLDIRLSFNQWAHPEEPFEGVTFASDVLRPLRHLPRALEALAVRVVFTTSTVASFTVRDADLESIGERWPDLVRLSVSHYIEEDDWPGGPEGIGRPSLGALVSLPERCRKLEVVDVEFHGVNESGLEKLEAHAAACEAPQTALRQIVDGPGCTDFCWGLYLTDPERVAAALRTLFPNVGSGLEVVEGEGTEDEEDSEDVRYRGWDEENMETDLFGLLEALEDADPDEQ